MTGEAERAALVDVIADVPGLAERLLQVHRPDEAGRCAACPRNGLGRVRWPCPIYDYARAASERTGPPRT